jgi:hypothetical protein
MGTEKSKGVGQWRICHADPLEPVVRTYLEVRLDTGDSRIVNDLVEHILRVQRDLLSPGLNGQTCQKNQYDRIPFHIILQ